MRFIIKFWWLLLIFVFLLVCIFIKVKVKSSMEGSRVSKYIINHPKSLTSDGFPNVPLMYVLLDKLM